MPKRSGLFGKQFLGPFADVADRAVEGDGEPGEGFHSGAAQFPFDVTDILVGNPGAAGEFELGEVLFLTQAAQYRRECLAEGVRAAGDGIHAL